MAITGGSRLPTPHDFVFPRGALVMGVEPVLKFQSAEERTKGLPVEQETDKETGMLVWSVLVIDQAADRKSDAAVTVKIAAAHRPVPPEAIPGTDVRPVVFEGLTVTPWIDDKTCRGSHGGERHRCRAKLGYSLRASGMKPVVVKTSSKAA
ncbi:hypothetical protein GCM10022243_11530 [Saccharothrix violaceirubra]|uniref:Plasmid replication, integration and excision activator n=1 Tax=Saccharothrix violaceirubra TaxID=413306 RepID=A0A7W7T8Q5_9PSEU|nr:plasmid replication, integration and excision activator [Saccharothrix violaceirubra]MBB4968653.1 hypothetical protein [Saccharothrix violaceirubra]